MPEKTIHFDNPREAQDLTGRRGEYLSRFEKALGVRMVTRDTWLKIDQVGLILRRSHD